MSRRVISLGAAALAAAVTVGCSLGQPRPGTVQDEAMRAGVTPEQLVRPTDDYFRDMDYNVVDGKRPAFTQPEIEGRNMWMVWTGGDDRLWDTLAAGSLGSFDLLKTISSHPDPPDPAYGTGYGRHNRWRYLGLVNEPCFKEATGPDPSRFGLWLDVRDPACPPDPFANAERYPGITDRRPRPDRAGRLLLRRADRHRRPAAVSEPGFRREGARALELRPVLQRPRRTTWIAISSGRTASAMSCGFCHVGPESDQAAGGSREPQMGRAQLERRRPVFLVGSRLQLARRAGGKQLLLSGAAHLAAGHARYVARLDRQHRQSPDDERRLRPAAAHARGEEMGTRRRLRAVAWTTSSSTTTCRQTIRCRSSSPGRARPGRLGCSRTDRTRSARSAR